MNFPLRPYAKDALEPYISALTLDYHYEEHHRTYVEKLNKAISGTAHAAKDLEALVCTTTGDIFNNAGQVWTTTFTGDR